MSERADKRRKADLDLFVLALIAEGVSTPYELQKAAGLSQGATIPALQRLLSAGFLVQGKPGLRGRTDYRVSPTGKRHLKSGWVPLIEAGPSGDADADLRVALLALWGGNRRLATRFLLASADRKREVLPRRRPVAKSIDTVPLAEWYRRLRSVTTTKLTQAESAAARLVAESLPTKLPGRMNRH